MTTCPQSLSTEARNAGDPGMGRQLAGHEGGT